MTEDENQYTKLGRAQKRVKAIKGFYQHLTVYLVVNIILLLLSGHISVILISDRAFENVAFLNWINWNLWGTPIGWGIALVIHAMSVFLKSPFKGWEERQIRKIMEEDTKELNKFGNRSKSSM